MTKFLQIHKLPFNSICLCFLACWSSVIQCMHILDLLYCFIFENWYLYCLVISLLSVVNTLVWTWLFLIIVLVVSVMLVFVWCIFVHYFTFILFMHLCLFNIFKQYIVLSFLNQAELHYVLVTQIIFHVLIDIFISSFINFLLLSYSFFDNRNSFLKNLSYIKNIIHVLLGPYLFFWFRKTYSHPNSR